MKHWSIEQKIYRYDKLANADDWDSNAITPGEPCPSCVSMTVRGVGYSKTSSTGTPFMAALDKHLHAWILRKFKTDPYFQPVSTKYHMTEVSTSSPISFNSSHSFSPAQACPVKENIKPWILLDVSVVSLAMSH